MRVRPADNKKHLAETIARAVKSKDLVLDVGCGDKWMLPHLQHADVSTLDAWPKFEPDFTVNLEDGMLPFPCGCFDVVLMLDVIEHLTRAAGETILKEAQRVSSRSVFLLTPTKWDENKKSTEDPTSVYYANVYNYHRSLWEAKDFVDFITLDIGGRYFFGEWRKP